MNAGSDRLRAVSPAIAIIGAGFAGICMGIRLKQAGIDSFTIFEKADAAGGVWRDNTYPGAACDVPSAVYSFSFEPRHDWPHVYSSQNDIRDYLDACVEKYDLRRHIRFNSEIAQLRFDKTRSTWRLRTTDGQDYEADIVISGVGQLSRPRLPDIPGLDHFAGAMFHSARWDHDHDLNGRNVAVIGNGASAIQFIPAVASQARRLLLFQRTPNWMISHLPRNRAYRRWEKWAFLHVPLVARLHRALIYTIYEARLPAFRKGNPVGMFLQWQARRHLHAQISDPELRAKLTPDYPIGCKRILLSSDFYPALSRPNVSLLTDTIKRVVPEGVVTDDEKLHRVDTLILATGFDVQNYLAPIRIEGTDGRVLAEHWKAGAQAYLGISVAGFPNLFLLYGPNTNLGHHSIIAMIESQVHYVMQCIDALRRGKMALLDVRPEVQTAYNQWLHKRLNNRVWAANCRSWYKSPAGKITSLWADSTIAYRRRTRRLNLADFGGMAPSREPGSQPHPQ